MNLELINIIDSVRKITLDDRLSDDAVTALVRCYISMQNLAAANGVATEYGTRKEFEDALNILYRICAKRCQSNQPFVRRSRMTPVLYMIAYMQLYNVELQRCRECNDLMYELVDEWMNTPETLREKSSAYGVLRCISNLCYYLADEDCQDDPYFMWFKQCVDDWVANLDIEGQWRDIPSNEALCRIEIMSRNSNMFLDASNDLLIEKISRNYCNFILEDFRRSKGALSDGQETTLFMLYQVMIWGIGSPNHELIDNIVECAKMAAHSSAGTDAWLMLQSAYIDWECMKIHNKLKYKTLPHSA